MVSLKEIYILNTVLDKRNYFTLPELSTVKMSALWADGIYEALRNKGLMADPDNYTVEGASLVQKMLEYKNARQYIKIGSVVIGLYKKDCGIALTRNVHGNQFAFERIKLESVVQQLSVTYPFLMTPGSSVCGKKKKVSYDELCTDFSLEDSQSLYISSFDMMRVRDNWKNAVTNEILFFDGRAHFCYNRDTEMLMSCDGAYLQGILLERLGCS